MSLFDFGPVLHVHSTHTFDNQLTTLLTTVTIVLLMFNQLTLTVYYCYAEFMFDGDKMEQKELVPMEQGKEEGNHWELTN